MWELPGEPPTPILRGHNTAAAFDKAIMFLDRAVKKKIRYYQVCVRDLSVAFNPGLDSLGGRVCGGWW